MNLLTQPERRLMGVEGRASNEDPQSIGQIWQRFMSEQLSDKIPDRADDKLIATYCDYEGDHTQPYTFFLGCAVHTSALPPDGFTVRAIASGQYMKHVATGTMPVALMDAWAEIWAMKIDRSYNTDFEIHDPSAPDSVDIYVGVS